MKQLRGCKKPPAGVQADRGVSMTFRKRSPYLRPVFTAVALLLMGFILGWLTRAAASASEWREPVAARERLQVARQARREPEATELISLGAYTITAYCSCEKCCGKWSAYNLTASGTTPAEGRTVAADWSVLSAGTEVYIDGVGWRTVEDTGSGVNGQRLDLYFSDHQRALEWGVREVEVWTKAKEKPPAGVQDPKAARNEIDMVIVRRKE